MKDQLRHAGTLFSEGTIACAIAHNVEDLTALADISVMQEASKTGGVLMILVMTIEKLIDRNRANDTQ